LFCFLSGRDRNIAESRVDEMNESTNDLEKRNESYMVELPEQE